MFRLAKKSASSHPLGAGLAHEWSLERYGELLEVGGGKERMDAYFAAAGGHPWDEVTSPEERRAFLKDLHELKTDIFNELIESGRLPVRPGVKRLIGEAGLGWAGWGTWLGRARGWEDGLGTRVGRRVAGRAACLVLSLHLVAWSLENELTHMIDRQLASGCQAGRSAGEAVLSIGVQRAIP